MFSFSLQVYDIMIGIIVVLIGLLVFRRLASQVIEEADFAGK